MSTRGGRWSYGIVGALLALVSLGWGWLYARFTIDDSFITWRYGETLVRYGQWNWQPNTPRVEAYTNPLYAALSPIPYQLQISPVLFFKLFSLVLLGWLVWFVLRLPLPGWQRLLALASLGLFPAFWAHLASGLETPLFVIATIVAFAMLTVRGSLGVSGLVVVVLLAASRPEGMVLAIAAVGWAWLIRRTWGRFLTGVGLGLALVGYWAARAWWFGALMPNTFYLKSVQHAVKDPMAARAEALGLALIPLLLVGAVAAALWFLRRRRAVSDETGSDDSDTRDTRGTNDSTAGPAQVPALAVWTPVYLAACMVVLDVGLYSSSYLAMNFANRFWWQLIAPMLVVGVLVPGIARRPQIPALVLAATAGIVMAAPTLRESPGRYALLALVVLAAAALCLRKAVPVLLAAAVLASSASVGWFPLKEAVGLATYSQQLEDAHGALGRALKASPERKRSLSMGDVGAAPLLSGWRTLDTIGLTNVARAHGAELPRLAHRWKPRVVVVTTLNDELDDPRRRGNPMYRWAERKGYRDLGFVMLRPEYYLRIMVAPDTAPETKRLLRTAIAESRANERTSLQQVRDEPWRMPFMDWDDFAKPRR